MLSPFLFARAVVLSLLLAGPVLAQQHEHGSPSNEKLGTVSFFDVLQRRGAAAVQSRGRAAPLVRVRRAPSRASTRRSKTDPSCAMAQWGIALSRWSNPFAAGIRPPAQLQQGRDAVESRARRSGRRPTRERAYIDAVVAAVRRLRDASISARACVAYRDAMAKLAAAYPDDTEASIFYALRDRGGRAADRQDLRGPAEGRRDPREAHRRASRIIPGLAHYIIHSYDVPALADRALDAARRYAKIAPSAPHALHMPSHTFTRVGYWQESIDTNIASGAGRASATARRPKSCTRWTTGPTPTCRRRRTSAARALLDALPEVQARFDPDAIGSAAPGSAGVFALAAIPARYALERGAWADAATLVPQPSRYPVRRRADATSRRRSARRAPATRPAARVGDRRAAARSAIGSRSRRKRTGPSRRRSSALGARRGSRSSKGARPKRSREMRAAAALRRCAPRRRRSRRARSRPRASCSARCCWR